MTTPNGLSAKSYLARSVDEAMAQAREELGPEAMLLNTRKLTGEPGLPGGYEVVFGLPELPPEPQPAPTVPENLAADLERLHAQMDEIRNLLMRSASPSAAARTAPDLAEIHDCLLAAEVDPVLSKDIVDRLGASRAVAQGDRTGRGKTFLNDHETLEALVLAELERRVPIAPRLGQNGVVLIGPAGAGKTAAAAKLAGFLSDLAETRPVRLLSVSSTGDTKLQEIAKTLQVAFTEAPEVQMLPSLIAEHRKTEFLVIDMPAYSATGRNAAKSAAAALAECPGIDVHLVVPGYMKPIDLRRAIQRHEIFQPSKLLVTKLDETHSFGSVFSEAARAGLALSFLSYGPAIPRDIRPASAEDLLALALEGHLAPAANVA